MWTSHLTRGSSPVDWCEDNYTYTPFIAEFFNTVSNVLFLIMPPFLMHLHQPYAACIGPGIHVVWFLLIVVGASSVYFHATLSLLGQLLDEMAILWVVMAGFAMWYPKAMIPSGLRDKEGRRTFTKSVLIFTLVSTYLGFLEPTLNAFFLMALGIPSIIMLIYNLRRDDDPRIKSLGLRSIILWVTAVTCWVNDKMYCEVWSGMGFPYLHGVWHVLIFLAAYTAVVLFAYFDVKHNHPHEHPLIQYWPKDSFELGIPFVQLKSYHLNKKEHNI